MFILSYHLLREARGEKKAELVLKNCWIVDVFNESLLKKDIAISKGIIIGSGSYEGEEEVDLEGQIVAPGFIDGHLHLESTMIPIDEFAAHVIPLGTTTIVTDPHEIANVAGIEGIKYFLQIGNNLPWNFNLVLPSCVPATNFETSGAELLAEDLRPLLSEKGVFGLGEVMNYPGVINGDKKVWDKLEMMGDLFIDGHAPALKDKALNAYLLAGIRADHECTTPEEALEKVSKGMYIMIREGSVTKDMERLLPIVNEKNFSRFLLATDDLHAEDILTKGHINYMIKKAISLGMKPLRAIRLATHNAALALGIRKVGAIAPGYKADLVVIDNWESLQIKKVYKDGKLVGENGKALFKVSRRENKDRLARIFNSIHVGEIKAECFNLPKGCKFRVIELIKDQVVTKHKMISFAKAKQLTISDLIANDLVKIAVVERHHQTGNVGLGLLKGYGLKEGAVATSIGHDSHNITVAGLDSADMLLAVREIEKLKGGIVIVKNQEIIGSLPLPIAGLMSEQSAMQVAEQLKNLQKIAKGLGIHGIDPFMALAFMSLAVIPELKITDKGLFDVNKFSLVDLVVK